MSVILLLVDTISYCALYLWYLWYLIYPGLSTRFESSIFIGIGFLTLSIVILKRVFKRGPGWLATQLLQYIPRNMHTVFALLCFVVVIHWLIFPYPSGLLHWHCGNLTIAPVPAKQPWWIWINTSCEFIMNDGITTTKQSTTKPCAYFLGYTVTTQSHARKSKSLLSYSMWSSVHDFGILHLPPPWFAGDKN